MTATGRGSAGRHLEALQFGLHDSTTFYPGYRLARSAGFRLTGHKGENSTASDIAACLEVLGLERIDHGVPVLDDDALTASMAAERIPITVCPTSHVVIAGCFERLEDHVYPRMRAAGPARDCQHRQPALTDLNLGQEYAAVAHVRVHLRPS